MTRLTAGDGHELDAYEAHPDGASASIVIVQEIFGVNAHIRSVVDHSASFGYCFGGSVAWIAAEELPIQAAVGYYGGQIHAMIERRPKVPTMLHFGELDHGIPLDQVDAIADAHPDVAVHVYPDAEHGFSCDVRASHDARSAAIALGRTLDFLAHHGVTP